MKVRFKSFKNYFDKLDSKQINFDTLEDLSLVKQVIDHMKPVLAGKKEIPLLQYGMFFDGEHLFYDDQEVYELDQEVFNHAVLNHAIHFVFGAHTNIGFAANAAGYYRDITALMFAHFNISGVTPKYANSRRNRWYEKIHLENKGYGTIFAPHLQTANYFYEQYETGTITLPKGFSLKQSRKFDCVEGIVYIAEVSPVYLKLSGIVIGYDYKPERKQVVLLKNEDGTFERINHVNKKSKELRGYREVMEILSGDDGDWDDN